MSERLGLCEVLTNEKIALIAKWIQERIPVPSTVAVGVADYDEEDNQTGDPTVLAISPPGTAINQDVCETLVSNIIAAASTVEVGERIDYDIVDLPVITLSVETENLYWGIVLVSVQLSDVEYAMDEEELDAFELELEKMIIDTLPYDEGGLDEEECEESQPMIWLAYGNFGWGDHLFDICLDDEDDDECWGDEQEDYDCSAPYPPIIYS